MNINEVIANRANELLGGKKGSYDKVHPNDHVNMAQSTNDVIPTAGKLTVLTLMTPLLKELGRLEESLFRKSEEFDDVIKWAGPSCRMQSPCVWARLFTDMLPWSPGISDALPK